MRRRRPIFSIFIMLGNECNLNCKYCIQHVMVNEMTPHGINKDLVSYIKRIADRQNHPLKIMFYGGEPLIWFEDIKKYAKELESYVNFAVITNGKLLDEEKIDFLNEFNIGAGVSYDGKNSKITRGYDVLEDKYGLLLKINSLSFSGVISTYNYPKDWLDNLEDFAQDYVKKHNMFVGTNLDLLMNNNNLDNLNNFDMSKIRTQMIELCDIYYQNQISKKENVFSDTFIKDLLNMSNNKPNIKNYGKCGNGITVQNIDADGDMYLCHNSRIKIGNLSTTREEMTKKCLDMYKPKLHCEKCNVLSYCGGGCMLSTQEDLDSYYCELTKNMYEPVKELYEKLKETN